MKEIKVYNAIHQLKERGFKKDSVAKQLDINWRTVDRYWDMTVDEYESQAWQLKRGSQLDDYQEQILLWLRQYPSMTAAQVSDWLKEHYMMMREQRDPDFLSGHCDCIGESDFNVNWCPDELFGQGFVIISV